MSMSRRFALLDRVKLLATARNSLRLPRLLRLACHFWLSHEMRLALVDRLSSRTTACSMVLDFSWSTARLFHLVVLILLARVRTSGVTRSTGSRCHIGCHETNGSLPPLGCHKANGSRFHALGVTKETARFYHMVDLYKLARTLLKGVFGVSARSILMGFPDCSGSRILNGCHVVLGSRCFIGCRTI